VIVVISTLDEIDIKILKVLQEEGRISMLDLADRVGLSATPCARRVKEMESMGVIRGYAALLNAEAVGLGTQAVVRVRLRRSLEWTDEFERIVLKMPEVLECARITGVYDYLLSVVAPHMEALDEWMRLKLLRLPGVTQTDTSIVMQNVKSAVALPVEQAGIGQADVRRSRLRRGRGEHHGMGVANALTLP
jgi:Lrp/AsnC family transcriptional regulator, leucine-responsive regulatory protein